jgi:hypothetical protein
VGFFLEHFAKIKGERRLTCIHFPFALYFPPIQNTYLTTVWFMKGSGQLVSCMLECCKRWEDERVRGILSLPLPLAVQFRMKLSNAGRFGTRPLGD